MVETSLSFGGSPLTPVELFLDAAKGPFEENPEVGFFVARVCNDVIPLQGPLSAKLLRVGVPSPVLMVEKRLRRTVSGTIEGLKIFGIKKRILANLLHFCFDECESP